MASVFDILERPPLKQRGPSQRWLAATDEVEGPIQRVMRAAWGAATVGEAFFAGYQGALEQLLGAGNGSQALLVTEAAGQHPRDLTTRLEGGVLNGEKTFAMLQVDTWWVLAVAGPRDLRLARVAPQASGVASTPFDAGLLADVPHGSVSLRSVAVDVVHTEAWARYVRPFRALEDTGVLLALATALLGAVADPDHEEALLGMLAALTQLFGDTSDGAFRALIGVRRQLVALAAEAQLDGPLAAAWHEHRPLVGIAQRARGARLEQARTRTTFRAL